MRQVVERNGWRYNAREIEREEVAIYDDLREACAEADRLKKTTDEKTSSV